MTVRYTARGCGYIFAVVIKFMLPSNVCTRVSLALAPPKARRGSNCVTFCNLLIVVASQGLCPAQRFCFVEAAMRAALVSSDDSGAGSSSETLIAFIISFRCCVAVRSQLFKAPQSGARFDRGRRGTPYTCPSTASLFLTTPFLLLVYRTRETNDHGETV